MRDIGMFQANQSTAALFRLHLEDWVPPPQPLATDESTEVTNLLKSML